MYVVSMIGMSREIYFVYLIAFINKHLKCLFLLFGGKDLVLYAHPYMVAENKSPKKCEKFARKMGGGERKRPK